MLSEVVWIRVKPRSSWGGAFHALNNFVVDFSYLEKRRDRTSFCGNYAIYGEFA